MIVLKQKTDLEGAVRWVKSGSFFWGALLAMLPIFRWSTIEVSSTDQLVWRWKINGHYSAKSTYAVMVGGGKIAWPYTHTWRYNVPPTVHIFTYLLIKSRLLTRKMMARRGFPCSPTCETCGLRKIESVMHLFFKCPKAVCLWNRMATIIGVRLLTVANTVVDTWNKSVLNAANSGMGKKQWSVYFISTCWSIWKQRNKKIFEGKETPLKVIEECTLQEAKLWIQNC